jgi:hypothetical protein
MTATAAFALATAIDVAFFTPPPHRSSRPDRSQPETAGLATTVLQTIRRALTDAAREPEAPWLPELRNYPY